MNKIAGMNEIAFNQNEDAMKLAIRQMERRMEKILEGGGKKKD